MIKPQYEIDSELLESKYNQTRKPSLPYGIVINGEPAGILIPKDQLLKAEWQEMPTEEELTTIEFASEVTGLLLSKCRMLVLAFVPEYVRWKDLEENGERAGTFIALYEDYRHRLDKKTQDVCSEHALVFLDSKNLPLHKVPIVVRFKNVALWSFKSAREEFYRALEKVFADYFETDYSGKNDKWRSLGILKIEFRAEKEGEGRNKSLCCKTSKITAPTPNNFSKLFLGQLKRKQQIWHFHNTIAGFTEGSGSHLPALTTSAEPDVEVLPPSNNNNKSLRRINPVEERPELDEDLDDWEGKVEEDFS